MAIADRGAEQQRRDRLGDGPRLPSRLGGVAARVAFEDDAPVGDDEQADHVEPGHEVVEVVGRPADGIGERREIPARFGQRRRLRASAHQVGGCELVHVRVADALVLAPPGRASIQREDAPTAPGRRSVPLVSTAAGLPVAAAAACNGPRTQQHHAKRTRRQHPIDVTHRHPPLPTSPPELPVTGAERCHALVASTSAAPRRLDRGDVDLLHRHHRVERALGVGAAGMVIASVSTRGVICQDKPQRSLHQPHALSWPPLPTIAFQ